MPGTPVSRRSVLHAGSLLPAAAIRSSAANSAPAIGLIGAGGRGSYDAELLVKHTPARIAMICDIQEDRLERAKAAHPGARAVRDLQEVLKSDVDAVLIATPVFLHPEHLEAAIRAGKHVYIEKPAGADVAGCLRVRRLADAADRRIDITFGFQQRYAPCSRKAHALVSSGALGPMRFAHSHWIKGQGKPSQGPPPAPANAAEKLRTWKLWRETFGDFIVETYCHGIDVLNWFLGGHPESAVASGTQTVLKRNQHHDSCGAIFIYPGGRQATMTGSQIAPLDHRDVNERFYFAETVIETAREYWRRYRAGKVTEEREPHDVTIDSLRGFIDRVRSGRPENAGVSAADSTLTAILARTAMDRKREVTWKELVG